MKWPKWLMLVRHDTSIYNLLKKEKEIDPKYAEFLNEWKVNPLSKQSENFARQIQDIYTPKITGDADTPLADPQGLQAQRTGAELRIRHVDLPDVVFVSPYRRAKQTLASMVKGWPELSSVHVHEEERVREQEYGLSLIYTDRRVFETLNPDQHKLRKIEGPYWYRFPQGENVPDVRERNRSWMNMVVQNYSGKKVMVITHHLNILAQRANFEGFGAETFIRLDRSECPINCGVTLYRAQDGSVNDTQMNLEYYNKKFY